MTLAGEPNLFLVAIISVRDYALDDACLRLNRGCDSSFVEISRIENIDSRKLGRTNSRYQGACSRMGRQSVQAETRLPHVAALRSRGPR